MPESTDKVVILRPIGKTFVTGIACAYSEEFDKERLSMHMDKRDFTFMMENLNNNLEHSFPCTLCWILGYLFAPFTLGLSLLCLGSCIGEAEDYLKD